MRSEAGNGSAMYFIAWIFIGNIVILNLFLAILLDSFSDGDSNDDEELDEQYKLNPNIAKRRRNSLLQL